MSIKKDITFKIRVDGKELDVSLVGGEKQIKKMMKTAEGVSSKMAKWSQIATGFNSVLNIANNIMNRLDVAIDKYALQQQAVAKVQQAIESTGKAAGFSANQLERAASQLQAVTTYGDEAILNNASAQLLTFTNIVGENFLRTQKVAMDVATVLSDGPEQAAGRLKDVSIMLGKALNDPVANLSALSRAGIQFSKDQKEVIKNLATTNKLSEAQSIILTELEKQYGGQAMKVAQLETGKLKQISNELGDQLEKIGQFAVKIILPIKEIALNWTKGFTSILGLNKKVSDSLKKSQIEFNALVNVVTSLNAEEDTRKKAIEQLNSNYSEYIGNLNLEKAAITDIYEMQKKANEQFIKKIELAAAEEQYAEHIAEAADIQQRLFEVEMRRQKFIEESEQKFKDRTGLPVLSVQARKQIDLEADMLFGGSLQQLKADREAAQKEFEEFQRFVSGRGINLGSSDSSDSPGNVDVTTGSKVTDQDKYYEQLKRLRIENMTDERERKIAMLEFERELALKRVDNEVKNTELAGRLKNQIKIKYANLIQEATLMQGTSAVDKPDVFNYEATEEYFNAFDELSDASINTMQNAMYSMWDNVFGKSKSIIEMIAVSFLTAFSDKAVAGIIGSIFGDSEGGIEDLFKGVLSFIPGGSFLSSILPFAKGGITTKPTLGVLSENRQKEAVIPLDSPSALSMLTNVMKSSVSYRTDTRLLAAVNGDQLAVENINLRLKGEDIVKASSRVGSRKSKWELN